MPSAHSVRVRIESIVTISTRTGRAPGRVPCRKSGSSAVVSAFTSPTRSTAVSTARAMTSYAAPRTVWTSRSTNGAGSPSRPNDKNDIEHGYAALYRELQGRESDYVYLGTDKLSNNGDAAIGFWFLQNDVTQVGNIGGNPALDFSPNNADTWSVTSWCRPT